MRIVSLTSDEPHHLFLISLLSDNFQVVGSIVEPGIQQRRRLRNLKLRSSYFWFTYHYIRRKIFRLDSYRRKYFDECINWKTFKDVNSLTTSWINSELVLSSLLAWEPDIVIVCGTSIIQPQILNCCKAIFLNIHGGYLPDYRGNHCIFFALYEQAYDKIGASIHFVSEGIDTGDIVEVVQPEIIPSDNAEKIYCRADHLAFERLIELLHAYDQGTVLPRLSQPPMGRTFKMKDRKPLHDVVYWLKRTLRIIAIPKIPKA
jgi:methionyl-tRNA formyltransferase